VAGLSLACRQCRKTTVGSSRCRNSQTPVRTYEPFASSFPLASFSSWGPYGVSWFSIPNCWNRRIHTQFRTDAVWKMKISPVTPEMPWCRPYSHCQDICHLASICFFRYMSDQGSYRISDISESTHGLHLAC
jgi:hypothetical protein